MLVYILHMMENLLWHERHEKGKKIFQPFRQMVLELSKI
jgi:hypothetical protein